MTYSFSTKVLSVIAAAGLLLTGCGRDDEKSVSPDLLVASSDILQYVPADSPYVIASLAPLPDDVMDSLEPKIDRILLSYQTILREAVAAQQDQSGGEQPDSEEAQQVRAFVDELAGLLSIDGMREAGVTRDSLGAFYGNGLLPVLRLQLSDSAKFEAAIKRLEAEAGKPMAVGMTSDQPYRYLDADEIRVVIAIIDDQAVFSLVPSAFDEAQTGRALGLSRPDSNITQSGVFEEIVARYDYEDYVVGFVDLPQIAERFVGEPTGLDVDLMALLPDNSNSLSDVCKAEIREVARVMPRMVIGYTNISATQFDSNLVIELRDDIAAGLQLLPAAVPGLGGDTGALMSFGMSLDAKAAREFFEARLDALEADPFECEHFADIERSAASGREALNQPLPPIIYDFKGFLAVIDDLEGLDVATQTPPTSFDGTFLLAMDNAPALVSMGTMFSPELAALNLQPDGKPVALELPQLQAMGIAAFAALTDTALAISVGEKADAEVQEALAAEAAKPAPFLSFSMDAARYYSFMGEAVAAGDAAGEDAPSPEMKTAVNEMMQAVADLYDRMSGDVLFTANGIEVRMTETLKD
jgi:hypothetical protein